MSTQRENILSTATQLFYEHGYDDSYFYQIAEALNITKSLISYHFKTKSLLAKEVTENFSVNNKNSISFKLYHTYFCNNKYDLQLSTAIEIRLSTSLILHDPNVARYIRESSNGNYEDMFTTHYKSFYKIHDRQYHLNINRQNDEISMLARGATAASHAIIIDFINNMLKCTLEECLDYIVEMNFRFMRVDEKRIAEVIKKSKEVIDKVGFEFKPYFIIE
ncbi:TetR/AcrR family transcriptional regulator [Acetobacterium carbinolicum]|uniref:TetR/AcrR family transcriptional regulator n=1 Tax=Acetobacterium carbinolicum TaxID=52690 RepID=UPI0039BF15F6